VHNKKIKSLEGVTIADNDSIELNTVWKFLGVEFIDIKKERDNLTVYFFEINENNNLIKKEKKFNDFFEKKESCWTYILIHQSIIDDHIDDKFEKTYDFLASKCRFFIIHTGRGAVKVKEGFKFIGYSNLEEALLEKPNKFKFINKLSQLTGGNIIKWKQSS